MGGGVIAAPLIYNTMETKAIAEVYLKSNPAKKEIFICSDGNAFWSEIPARNHAFTIRGTYTKYPEVVAEVAVVTPKKKKK
jgi:hypothetical protein